MTFSSSSNTSVYTKVMLAIDRIRNACGESGRKWATIKSFCDGEFVDDSLLAALAFFWTGSVC
jgi:hypothetical protein